MKTINKISIKAFLLVILIGLCSWESRDLLGNEDETSLIVIANIEGVETLTFNELKLIMRGEKQRWKSGVKVGLALMKASTPTGGITAEKIYHMSSNQLNKYWLAQVFQGRVQTPEFFVSEAALIEYVEQTPGAIGVVSAKKESTQKVKIDGKSTL